MSRFADWYFDYVSPFSYLQMRQFDRLPADLEVRLVPVLFAALLEHHGHKGPAEIDRKRDHTYRFCRWYANRLGIPFRMPGAHPFNPLVLLRETIRCRCEPIVVETFFRAVFEAGLLPDCAAFWEFCANESGMSSAPPGAFDDEVKYRLRSNTEQATRIGVFGVPTFVVDGRLFWGVDSTDMLLDYLDNPSLFDDPEYRRLADLPVAVRR